MTDTCLNVLAPEASTEGVVAAKELRPAVFGRLVKVVLLVSLGFIGGLLVSGRAQDAHHGPVNVAVHLNGVQGSAAQYSAIPSAPELTERKLNVGGEQQDVDRLLKAKKTKSPTNKPTAEPTGTKSPTSERRLRLGEEKITLKRNARRELKKSVDEGVFAPGDETYNPTPVQFHPTKKPSSERRSLKAKKTTSKPTNKPTSEPTSQATFPHGTASPNSERRALKKKTTSKPTNKPTSEPTFQATFPHGTASPNSERKVRTLKVSTPEVRPSLSNEEILKAATTSV